MEIDIACSIVIWVLLKWNWLSEFQEIDARTRVLLLFLFHLNYGIKFIEDFLSDDKGDTLLNKPDDE